LLEDLSSRSKIPPHPQKDVIPFARFGRVFLVLKFIAEPEIQFADEPVEVAARDNQILVLTRPAL
jgi:hypothetical protein